MKSVEHRSGQPGQVGAVSRLTYDENGTEIQLEEIVRARKEPGEFSGTYDNSMSFNTIRNTFIELGENKTKWVLYCEFSFKGRFKLLSAVMGSRIKKRISADMIRFKKLVESS